MRDKSVTKIFNDVREPGDIDHYPKKGKLPIIFVRLVPSGRWSLFEVSLSRLLSI